MKHITSYVSIGSWAWWKYCWRSGERKIGIFKNLPTVRPGRWGFYILGFEVGSRNPGDPIGCWLIAHGLWRW